MCFLFCKETLSIFNSDKEGDNLFNMQSIDKSNLFDQAREVKQIHFCRLPTCMSLPVHSEVLCYDLVLERRHDIYKNRKARRGKSTVR